MRSAIVFCNRKTTVRELTTSLKRGRPQCRARSMATWSSPSGSASSTGSRMTRSTSWSRPTSPRAGSTSRTSATSSTIDVPWHPDDYVHRIGRTGRAGKTGIAITLVTGADQEFDRQYPEAHQHQDRRDEPGRRQGESLPAKRRPRTPGRTRNVRAAPAVPAAATRPRRVHRANPVRSVSPARSGRRGPSVSRAPNGAAERAAPSVNRGPRATPARRAGNGTSRWTPRKTAAGTARCRASWARASAASVKRAAALLACACLPGQAGAQAQPRPEASLRSYLQHQLGEDGRDARYASAFADLNGDRRPEAIVYLMSGTFCGTGGCVLLVLTPQGGWLAAGRPPDRGQSAGPAAGDAKPWLARSRRARRGRRRAGPRRPGDVQRAGLCVQSLHAADPPRRAAYIGPHADHRRRSRPAALLGGVASGLVAGAEGLGERGSGAAPAIASRRFCISRW